MTVGQLLAGADSHELTEWQAWTVYQQQVEDRRTDGRKTVKWSDD